MRLITSLLVLLILTSGCLGKLEEEKAKADAAEKELKSLEMELEKARKQLERKQEKRLQGEKAK